MARRIDSSPARRSGWWNAMPVLRGLFQATLPWSASGGSPSGSRREKRTERPRVQSAGRPRKQPPPGERFSTWTGTTVPSDSSRSMSASMRVRISRRPESSTAEATLWP